VQTAVGSFGRKEIGADLGWTGNHLTMSARYFNIGANNDFPYQKQGLDGRYFEVLQQNNKLQKVDFQQFISWKPSRLHEINTAFWTQKAVRELPPSSKEAVKQTWQYDHSNRLLLTWNYTPSLKNKCISRLAFLQDDLAFHLSGDTDTSKSRQLIWNTEWMTQAKKIIWKGGVQATRQWAQVDGYTDSLKWYGQTRVAAYGMGAWQIGDLKGSLMIRQEWAEDQGNPFVGSLGAEWKPGRVGAFRMHLARNFNLPTLNDRFWRNLGNTALRPEKGYSADIGWQWQNQACSIGLSGFHVLLDDWILWQPDASGLFRPGNLRKVWSRGVEGIFNWAQKWGDIHCAYSGRVQYSATTLEAIYNGSEGVIGAQLPYTSRFSSGHSVKLSYKTTKLAYLHQITGRRPDLIGNELPSFFVGTLLLANSLFKSRLHVEGRLENMWNTTYEVIRYRPMPGRSWRVGLSYYWN
jgi:iron complex outermembrane receptor protein